MSNIFIRDIDGVGGSVFAVPTSDAELAAASAALNAIVTTVPTLSYAALLAWVETSDGGSASRTLNALVQNFEYNTKECPTAAEVDTMTAAIKALLEANVNINSIGSQQVSLYQVAGVQPITRDPAGFVYPTEATDEFYIGGATPNGIWFPDGDMVLGASGMFGTERLRVVGDVRIESLLYMPVAGTGSAVLVGATAQVSGEGVRTLCDLNAGSTRGILSDFADTSGGGGTFTAFSARFQGAVNPSGIYRAFGVDPSGGGPGWTHVGFHMPDMTGTSLQGSDGFLQEGPNETNRFAGRCAFGGPSVGSSSSIKVSTPSLGSAVGWTNVEVDRGSIAITGGANWDMVRCGFTAVNAAGQVGGAVSYFKAKTPVSAQPITILSCAGLLIEPLNGAPNYTFTNNPYGIYQQGATDLNYFRGQVGIGVGKAIPAVDLDVAGSVNCDGGYQVGAVAGVSGTFTTTDLKTVTVTNGIITNIV
jgi:hypothetical protein